VSPALGESQPIAVRLRLKAFYINSVGQRPTKKSMYTTLSPNGAKSNIEQDYALSALKFSIISATPGVARRY